MSNNTKVSVKYHRRLQNAYNEIGYKLDRYVSEISRHIITQYFEAILESDLPCLYENNNVLPYSNHAITTSQTVFLEDPFECRAARVVFYLAHTDPVIIQMIKRGYINPRVAAVLNVRYFDRLYAENEQALRLLYDITAINSYLRSISSTWLELLTPRQHAANLAMLNQDSANKLATEILGVRKFSTAQKPSVLTESMKNHIVEEYARACDIHIQKSLNGIREEVLRLYKGSIRVLTGRQDVAIAKPNPFNLTFDFSQIAGESYPTRPLSKFTLRYDAEITIPCEYNVSLSSAPLMHIANSPNLSIPQELWIELASDKNDVYALAERAKALQSFVVDRRKDITELTNYIAGVKRYPLPEEVNRMLNGLEIDFDRSTLPPAAQTCLSLYRIQGD